MTTIETVLSNAQQILPTITRSTYASNVLSGNQRWSGADLQGKAKRYGRSYAKARGQAAKALRDAGGELISCEHGMILPAVLVGTDDYGTAIYQTERGTAQPHGKWCKHVA